MSARNCFATVTTVCGVLAALAPSAARGQCLPAELEAFVAGDPGVGDNFGQRLAIDGDVCVIGAPRDSDPSYLGGSAYVFRHDGLAWVSEQKLTPDDGAAQDRVGAGVAISGDIAVVGSDLDDDAGENSGSVYIYRYDAGLTAWVWQAKLLAGDGEAGDAFGRWLAISDNTLVVGAPGDDDLGSDSGSAYVFVRDDGGTPGDPADDLWIEQFKLLASDGAAGDQFGVSVAAADNTVIIGAPQHADQGAGSGSAYVFVRDDAGTPADPYDDFWFEQAELHPDDAQPGSSFGNAVSISGDTLVIGASGDDHIFTDAGSAYVFRRDDGGTPDDPGDDLWNQEAKLVPDNVAPGDRFGGAVAHSADTVIIGAYLDDDAGDASGSAYVFRYESESWVPVAKLLPTLGAAGDRSGVAVAISGDTALVGADRSDLGQYDGGAIFAYGGLSDCNENGILDLCDIADGASLDENGNGVPDECENEDCNDNGVPDWQDLADGTSLDCNGNDVPDECDVMFTELRMGSPQSTIVGLSTTMWSLANGDFDGDGDEDLVAAVGGDGAVYVLLNRGDGSFTWPPDDYSVGANPQHVAAADVTGDGLPELIVANKDSNNVSVLINLGDGQFGSGSTYGTGRGPRSVTLEDFDNDGDHDIAVANEQSDNISVLLNNGDGTFSATGTYAAGDTPYSVTAARLDGDEYPDLAVANCYSHDVAVLINQGDGTFAAPVHYAEVWSFWRCYIVSGDVDNDGDVDLAVTNGLGGESVTVLRNAGDGTFPQVNNYYLATDASPSCLAIGDLDHDGYPDIVTANRDHDNLTFMRNTGDGTFGDFENFSVGHYLMAVLAVDLNGDARLDLAVGNGGSNLVHVLLNESTSTSEDCNENGIPDECDLADGTSFDCNGDGVPDECQSEIGPTILEHPGDRYRYPGDPVTFSVEAVGTGDLYYQWRHDGEDVPGATESSYTIAAVEPDDAGEYDVIVGDDCGPTTSESATLHVLLGPEITQQPRSQDVCEGESATFSVSADGSDPLRYQWRKDGVDISGATASSYTIESVTVDDAGDYDVVVTDDYGTAESDPATLTVHLYPSILEHPESQAVCDGDTVTLSVVADDTGDLNYQWFKDGYLIPEAIDPEYTIEPVSVDDAGVYEVEVGTDHCSVTSEPATLTVSTGPIITEQPQDQTVFSGSSVTFRVVAEGTPPLDYQWFKDGAEITGATASAYTIDAATADDAGTYDVLVSDACGEVRSAAAVLTVETSCPGDLDGDGDVDLADLAQFLSAYGCCDGDACYLPEADFNEDGCVDLGDLATLLSAYGMPC